MLERTNTIFEIRDKANIESIIGASDLIPENVLSVQKRTRYEKKLKNINQPVSIAIVARARLGNKNYIMGYIEDARIVFVDVQAKPLMIRNQDILEKEKNQFRENNAYPFYEIEILSPPMKLMEFLNYKGALAPYATPDRLQ